jgi:6-hydroxymethylpterin diphosphokinase MptE-like protein
LWCRGRFAQGCSGITGLKSEIMTSEEITEQRENALRSELQNLIKELPTKAPIFLPTEKISLEEQLSGLKKVRNIYQKKLKTVYRQKLRNLKEKYKGHERAFIIGNGPSLNVTDLSQLENEVTFCVNSFFLKMPELSWTPTFYVVEDHLVAEDRAVAINALRGMTKLFPAYLGYCLDEADDTIFFNHRPRKSYPHGFDFSCKADEITYAGCTVTYTCMQLAHYFGFKEIYLIGVDASYDLPKDVCRNADYGTAVLDMASDDPNHFHPDYFGKGYRWHDPQVNKMLEAYAEARAVTDSKNRSIYNATIGGELEVFKRKSFKDVFPDALDGGLLGSKKKNTDAAMQTKQSLEEEFEKEVKTTKVKFPKLLIIDMTRMGGATATGELKSTLLEGYPASRLLHIYSNGKKTVGIEGGRIAAAKGNYKHYGRKSVLDTIHQFAPDAILYRPVDNEQFLHEIARDAIAQTGAPLATWIMDAWQDRLKRTDPKHGERMEKELNFLFERSAYGLAISEKMVNAYGRRYGAEFKKFSNAVSRKDWEGLMKDRSVDGDTLLIRYSGAMAADMTLDSVRKMAGAVEKLAKNYKIKFEINTGRQWLTEYGHYFKTLKHTSIFLNNKTPKEYRAWLSGADISLIAYNFSQETIDYVGLSMANKLPECLASGSLLFAVGPKELACMSYLRENNIGVVVDEVGEGPIQSALEELLIDRTKREALAKAGQEHGFEYFDLRKEQVRFRKMVTSLAQSPRHVAIERPKRKIRSLKMSRHNSFLGRMARFFMGGRGFAAAVIIGLFALPALGVGGFLGSLFKYGPPIGAGLLLLLVGNWISQILDRLE